MTGFVRRAGLRFAFCYLLLYNLQLALGWIPGAGWLLLRYQELWAAIVPWVGRQVLRLGGEIAVVPNGSGDRTFDHVQILCMAVLAGVAALAWTVGERRRPLPDRRLAEGLRILLRYGLGLALLAGGMSMMMKLQFPFPGLERLQERIGDASRLGLLEVFLGYSTPYAVFVGGAEALAGLLLFFRRTTTLGALLAMAALANPAMLAFSYGLPLKLHFMHLLAMAALLLAPDARRLVDGLVLDRPTAPAEVAPPGAGRRTGIGRLVLEAALAGYALLAVTRHGLDRRQELALMPRAPLHGVYDVEAFSRNGQVVASWSGDPARWRRLIVGSPAALTVQLMSGPRRLRTDYGAREVTLLSDEGAGRTVRRGTLSWSRPERDRLVLQGMLGGDRLIVELRRIDETGYLLVTRGFHLIDDDPINR